MLIPNEMTNLPRETDPFESDFPWIGRDGPPTKESGGSTARTHTFEEDLQRVLRIFGE